MYTVEVAKHKRHCGVCNGEIKAKEAHLVFGTYKDRLGNKNLCSTCMVSLLVDIFNYNEIKIKVARP